MRVLCACVCVCVCVCVAVQWKFLQRDEGEKEPENNPTWLEDRGMSIANYYYDQTLWSCTID